MRVGILDILKDSTETGWLEGHFNRNFRRHYASITPQAVAVWCRQLGHEVHYATYYGQQRLDTLLPAELDVVFIAAYTQASGLAYALAKLYRRRGARTVLGGPHATSFPTDSLRFFDLVVHHCDKKLIDRILRGDFPAGTVASSGHLLEEIPSVEERMPEIRTAGFHKGKPIMLSNVALLASLGCPYRCDFCVDAQNDYVMLPKERLAADLRYVSERLPGLLVSFHDPNFAVKFDDVLEVLEAVPEGRRNPYVMESSLSILRGERLDRLRRTNCIFVAPGVESWTEYSNKAGAGRSSGREKLESVIQHFTDLHEAVPALQANFIFGTDNDRGREPVELTKEFIARLPFVWPTINIPVPFGSTQLFDNYLAEDRILRAMPFVFYYMPNLVLRLRHYGLVEYYDLLIEIYSAICSRRLLMRRLASARTSGVRALHLLRTAGAYSELRNLRGVRRALVGDPELRAFHEGRSEQLPEYYRRRLAAKLGPFAELLSWEELTPHLEEAAAPPAREVVRLAARPRLDGPTAPAFG
ncbi:MAG: B12-binding domain-containing radical SAM protein [Thermoanaerobaculia bacterium]